MPWSGISQLGTPWDLRAYRWGRYRDTTAAFALLEYRFIFPFPKDTLWAQLPGWASARSVRGHDLK